MRRFKYGFQHGHAKGNCWSRTYQCWNNMIQRCTAVYSPSYKNYGARGITVTPDWLNFQTFLRDMGECPEGLEIDRIDNNKEYFKENCRWTTRRENRRNSSTTILNVYKVRLVKGLLRSVHPQVTKNHAYKIIGENFDVSARTIQDIATGATWEDVV